MAARRQAIVIVVVACIVAVFLVSAFQSRLRFMPQSASSLPTNTGASFEPRIWYPAKSFPKLSLPDGTQQTIRSVLNIAHPMRFGAFVWNDHRIPQGPVWVRIDLANQMLSVFRGGHEIGSAVILYGTDGKATPTGMFTVQAKAEDYHSITYDAPMPFMLRLTADGVAIHASDVRRGSATHGCIGIPLEFARRLFAQTRKGDMVVILASSGSHQAT